ncbi:MAG: type II toxin-antitoxin system MqsA family antitoxin [Chitinophagaceae bacterium]
MQCVICKIGVTRKDKASFTVENNGAFLVFSNVDADVCENCGEAYFDAETAKALQKKATEEFRKGNKIELIKF